MSFISKNLHSKRSSLGFIKGATLFFLGMSCILFVTKAFEITPIINDTKAYFKTLIFTASGSNAGSENITLDGINGDGYFAGTISGGKVYADSFCLNGDLPCITTWPVSGVGGGLPAGGNTQIQFNSGGLDFGASSNLVWNTTNGRLGINTASPTTSLDVVGMAKIGYNQTITASTGSSILGGSGNVIRGNYNTIVGGDRNTITGHEYGVIIGGIGNLIDAKEPIFGEISISLAKPSFETIINGTDNEIHNSSYSLIAGGRESVISGHQGVFLRSDSVSTGFSATKSDTFLINSSGGVGINTSNPNANLQVVGEFIVGNINNIANGLYSVAMGTTTHANGNYSVAMGTTTHASGQYSVAMGASTTANGLYSVAMGTNTHANGMVSVAMGESTTAEGNQSVAMGEGTISKRYNSLVIGQFNVGIPTAIFEIGIGTDEVDTVNALTVLDAGNIGIGTTTPSQKLTVNGNISFSSGADRFISVDKSTVGNSLTISAGSDDDSMHGGNVNIYGGGFYEYGNVILTKPGSVGGNVGIGKIAPTHKLEVDGDVLASSFLYSSDKRLKSDIISIQDPLKKILALNGYLFTWKNNGKKDMGVIAQEVEKVFPEIVSTDPEGYKSVQYGNLVAPLIEAIKELNAKVDAQAKEIKNLQAKIK